MKILVTGARGFIGRNLVETLANIRDGKDRSFGEWSELSILEYDIDTDPTLLDEYCRTADFVFNFAGVNRPKDVSEFTTGNFGFASILLDTLKKHHNKCPVMLSSSIQAELDNPYGKSKKAGEELFFEYGRETGAKVLVYRFPNVFGKWCRPNYNSAVATFCHNIAHDMPITVNDRSTVLTLLYIDDLVAEMIAALRGREHLNGDYCVVPTVYTVSLGTIADLLYSFRESRGNLSVPRCDDAFTKKLYAAYLSYLPPDKLSYPLEMRIDDRGSFTEVIKTDDRGLFSINIIKPGIVKGNHWHHTKNEKFMVASGEGVIRFREIGSGEIHEYRVSGARHEVVDIPTGYTHNIENQGDADMVVFMWANEPLDPDKPDTFRLEV